MVPWSIDLSADLAALADDALRGDQVVRKGVRAAVQELRDTLFLERGVPLPPGRVRIMENLPERHAVLSLFEVPACVIAVPSGVDDHAIADFVAGRALPLLGRRAADFIGLSETQRLLDELEQIAPALVRQVVPKPVSLPVLADVLRRLADERVGIRDLRAILEALVAVAPSERDPLNLAEFVRAQLRRAITFDLTGGSGELGVYLLDPSIEETVRHAITRTAAGSFLTLAPAAARDIVTAVRRAIAPEPVSATGTARAAGAAAPLVVLTQPDIRRFVRKLLETELPELTVVSFAELLPEITLRPLGKATLAGLG